MNTGNLTENPRRVEFSIVDRLRRAQHDTRTREQRDADRERRRARLRGDLPPPLSGYDEIEEWCARHETGEAIEVMQANTMLRTILAQTVPPTPKQVAWAEEAAADNLVDVGALLAPSGGPSTPGFFGAVHDLSTPPAPLAFIVPELELAPGRVNMVAGYSNSGKTTIVQAAVFALATGRLVWGRFAARPCRVLHLDFEAGEVVRENYARLARAHGVPLPVLAQGLTVVDARTPLTAPTFEAELVALIQREGYGVVVVDVLRAAAGGLDENKAEIAGPLYMLGRVSKATGATIVVLHHERKPDGEKRGAAEHMISGHNAIHGALQVSISLLRDDASGLVAVRPSKRIRKGFEPFALRFVDVPDPAGPDVLRVGEPSWGLRIEVVEGSTLDAAEQAARARYGARVAALGPLVVDWLKRHDPAKRGATVVELSRGLQAKKEDVAAALRELENAKMVVREKRGAALPYHLPRTPQEQWALDYPDQPYPQAPAPGDALAPPAVPGWGRT